MLSSATMISRILAALLAVVLFSSWELVAMLLRNPPWSILGVVIILFLSLLIGGLLGLLWLRPWGFYCAYLLVPVSTMLHGIPLVPFVTNLLPSPELRTWSVFILNFAFLVATIVAHLAYRTSTRNPGAKRQFAVRPVR